MRIRAIGPGQAHVRTAVQRASFGRSMFTDEHWHVMTAALVPPHAPLPVLDGPGRVELGT